jgi:hypothetical protein
MAVWGQGDWGSGTWGGDVDSGGATSKNNTIRRRLKALLSYFRMRRGS